MPSHLSSKWVRHTVIIPAFLGSLCFPAKSGNLDILDSRRIQNKPPNTIYPRNEAISIVINDSSMSINGKVATPLINNPKDHLLDFPDSSWNASYSKHVSSTLVGRQNTSIFITPSAKIPYVLFKPILRSIANAEINTALFVYNLDTIATEIYMGKNPASNQSRDPDGGFTRLMISSDSLWVCYGRTNDEFICNDRLHRSNQAYSQKDFNQIDSILSASRLPKTWVEIDPSPFLQFADLSLVMKWLSDHHKFSLILCGAL